MCLTSHRCETGALFHVFVILGVVVPKCIHSPFFYPSCAISFPGIVALIYYCIGCTGGASIACWLHWWCIVCHASHTITHSPALTRLLRDRTADGDIEKNPGPEDAQTTGNDIPPQHREMVTRLASSNRPPTPTTPLNYTNTRHRHSRRQCKESDAHPPPP